jgi:hypothetical protein
VGAKKQRPRAELIQALTEQRAALASSCEGFDSGKEWEAARLATTIFTLVHDGGSIVSLLSQLGIRGSLRFVSSGMLIPGNLLNEHPLVGIQMNNDPVPSIKALPLCTGMPPEEIPIRHTQFPHWWAEELIFRQQGVELTRRRLVFALRHQDGGGHVGELTDPSYVRIKTSPVWIGQISGQPDEPLYAMTGSVRQIAWEITKTLDDYGPVQ